MSTENISLKLISGIGKTSGRPYSALKITVGKWSTLHFPSSFELEYLVDYLKSNTGTVSINQTTDKLRLVAGDYDYDYNVVSKLEYKYIKDFFLANPVHTTLDSQDDAKIDLSHEDKLNENPFES